MSKHSRMGFFVVRAGGRKATVETRITASIRKDFELKNDEERGSVQ